MKLAVTLLFKAMPRVGDVIMVYALFLIVFAILGVQLFAGTFGSCTDAPHLARDACEAVGGAWENPPFGHFDNVLRSSLVLFEMASLEGWCAVR
jgi:hypothetical protein